MARITRDVQTGQALPLGLSLIAAGCLGAIVLFNTGQVATDKARLANAADAAAYSGLVWQARALNYQAYANRAMVANQVSMGQAVTLNAWTDYGAEAAFNINVVLGGVPFVGAFTNAMNQVMTGINTVVTPISEAVVAVVDTINRGLSISQEAMFESSFIATPDVVRKLVAATDPRFEVDTAFSLAGMAGNLSGWRDFTDTFENTDVADMAERGDVITASRDPFTRKRNWKFFDSIWYYSTPLSKHRVFREGQTHLAMREINGEMKWEWMAKDTMSLQNVLLRPWRLRSSDRRKWYENEIGWGEAYANDEGGGSRVLATCRGRGRPNGCGYVHRNRKAEREADDARNAMPGYTGVQAYRSLSVAAREHEDRDPRPRLRIEVALPAEQTTTSNEWISAEPFAAPVRPRGNVASSVSVAEVYYHRPDTYASNIAARKFESANGYNPYWDVRLAAVSDADRLGAIVARELTGSGGTAPEDRRPAGDDDTLGSYDDGVAGAEDAVDGIVDGADATIDGIGSDLEAYPTTLAAAYDLEGVDVSIASVSVADIAGLAMRDPVDLVRDNIEAEIEGAVGNILNAMSDTVSGIAESAVTQAIADFPGGQTVQGWADEAAVLNAEFEAIQTQVRDDFTVALGDAIGDYNTLVAPFVTDVTSLTTDLAAYELRAENGLSYSETVAQAFRDDIATAEGHIADARDGLVDLLRDRLIDIIRDHSDGAAWALELTDTVSRQSIRTILDGYFEDATGEGEGELAEILSWSVD